MFLEETNQFDNIKYKFRKHIIGSVSEALPCFRWLFQHVCVYTSIRTERVFLKD